MACGGASWPPAPGCWPCAARPPGVGPWPPAPARLVLDHPPRRSTRFEPADEAYLIGPYDELLAVLRRDRPSPGQPPDEATRPASGPSDQAPEPSGPSELTWPDPGGKPDW